MRFGFVSTRFFGTDGVSLEAAKWADVLGRRGHQSFWFCGLSDRDPGVSFVVPEAHFEHPRVANVNARVWNRDTLDPGVVAETDELRRLLKEAISRFVDKFAIDVLVPQNALTIPMHLSLGLAIADFVEETGVAAIAHHHDFHWERERFRGEAVRPWLEHAFPPRAQSLAHVVINSEAARQLRQRFGIEATVIPNVMDFDESIPARDASSAIREDLVLSPGDRFILQPTRIVPRKGIEHAIELLHRLDDPRNKLVVSHGSGDEGHDYRDHLVSLAREKSVDLRLVADQVASTRGIGPGGRKQYTLWDLYSEADFVTYPSHYEGFGNALLEAVYFRKPLLVNRYPIYREDIAPLGFDFITMDGEVTDEVVARVRAVLADRPGARPDTDRNFAIAAEHFGYRTLEDRLLSVAEKLRASLSGKA